jgi:hypothetical protein
MTVARGYSWPGRAPAFCRRMLRWGCRSCFRPVRLTAAVCADAGDRRKASGGKREPGADGHGGIRVLDVIAVRSGSHGLRPGDVVLASTAAVVMRRSKIEEDAGTIRHGLGRLRAERPDDDGEHADYPTDQRSGHRPLAGNMDSTWMRFSRGIVVRPARRLGNAGPGGFRGKQKT